MNVAVWVVVFVVGAAALSRAGVELARSGDQIAIRTGIGGLAVGTVLVAAATSLPEVLTAVAASLADAPDVAVGDLFGSSMANMAILAVVDLSYHGRVWPRVELGHARTGSVAVGLTALGALALLTPSLPAIGWVGLDTVLIAGAYLAAIAWVRRSPIGRVQSGVLPTPTGWGEAAETDDDGVGDSARAPVVDADDGAREVEQHGSLRRVVGRFAVGGIAVLVAAPVVAVSGREIAAGTGIEETIVGVVLIGISTSLPELVASLAAVRIGAHDLAVGNLLGSNAANMAVLVLVDLAYTDGPVLAAVDPSQSVVAVGAIVLMSLALAAIVHGEETRFRRLEPDAIVLLLAYLATLAAVFAAQP